LEDLGTNLQLQAPMLTRCGQLLRNSNLSVEAERDELNTLSVACGESLMHLEMGLKGVNDNLSLLQTLGPNSWT